ISRRETSTYILVLVVQGQLIYELNSSTETLSRGDLLLIQPGTYRTGRNDHYPPHQKYSAHFSIEPTREDLPLPLTNPKGYELFRPYNFEYLRQRFSLLLQTWRVKTTYSHYSINGIAMELFGAAMQ